MRILIYIRTLFFKYYNYYCLKRSKNNITVKYESIFLLKPLRNCSISNSIINNVIHIGERVNIKKTIIQNDVKILDNSQIYDSKLNEGCIINSDNYITESTIGKFTYTSRNCAIMSTLIGNYCSIARNVSIGTGDHPINFLSTSPFLYSPTSMFKNKVTSKSNFEELSPVKIGNDVWIGVNAVIKNGVKIGDGAIIGANSVVTQDVEPYSIVVGSPAKHLKYRFPPEIINEIIKLEWWDWTIDKLKDKKELFSQIINNDSF